MVGGWVGFETARKWWKKHRSGENLTRFYEISLDSVKISSDLREIVSESGKISPESGFFRWILENFGQNLGFLRDFGNFGRNLEIFQSVRVFRF